MAIFGIDTSQPVALARSIEAQPLIGGTPAFWGRFVNGTSDNTYQYTAAENGALNSLNIPVLFFARQTKEVSDASAARTHAHRNMQGIVDALGAQYLTSLNVSPIIYLDLEPEFKKDRQGHEIPAPERVLNTDYYKTWSAELLTGLTTPHGRVYFQPAAYLNLGRNTQSWLNLNAACADGAICVGVSVAHYLRQNSSDPTSPPPPYTSVSWEDANVRPKPYPIPPGQPDANIPILVWQYYGDYPITLDAHGKPVSGDIDLELVNPAYENLVMSGTVPAPATAVG